MNVRVAMATLSLAAATAVVVTGSVGAQNTNTLQGAWKNVDTVIRITVNKNEVKAQFADVGQGAKTLGFKPGDVSFSGTSKDQFMVGEQIIRYGSSQTCYKDGRKVPMMGKLSPDGNVIALHFYNVLLDAQCKDTGQYAVTETLWQRVR